MFLYRPVVIHNHCRVQQVEKHGEVAWNMLRSLLCSALLLQLANKKSDHRDVEHVQQLDNLVYYRQSNTNTALTLSSTREIK